jgi:hypothetical protein
MAWGNKTSFGALGNLAQSFEKQPQNAGNMPAPAMNLHPGTLKPQRGMTGYGTGPGLPPVPSAKTTQSPKQHMAVEKAAQASAGKRRKIV